MDTYLFQAGRRFEQGIGNLSQNSRIVQINKALIQDWNARRLTHEKLHENSYTCLKHAELRLYINILQHYQSVPKLFLYESDGHLNREDIPAFRETKVGSENFFNMLGHRMNIGDTPFHIFLHFASNFQSVQAVIKKDKDWEVLGLDEGMEEPEKVCTARNKTTGSTITVTSSPTILSIRKWYALLPRLMRAHLNTDFYDTSKPQTGIMIELSRLLGYTNNTEDEFIKNL